MKHLEINSKIWQNRQMKSYIKKKSKGILNMEYNSKKWMMSS